MNNNEQINTNKSKKNSRPQKIEGNEYERRQKKSTKKK